MYEESNKVKEALKDELEGRKSDLEAAVNNLVDNYNELKLQLREYEEMNEASIILAQKLREENEELKNAVAMVFNYNPDDLIARYRRGK